MQIVIDIDDKLYDLIKHYERSLEIIDEEYDTLEITLMRAIINGTPLPKGHGRLIDADEIQFGNTEFDTYGDYCIAFDAIDEADTIIGADMRGDTDDNMDASNNG